MKTNPSGGREGPNAVAGLRRRGVVVVRMVVAMVVVVATVGVAVVSVAVGACARWRGRALDRGCVAPEDAAPHLMALALGTITPQPKKTIVHCNSNTQLPEIMSKVIRPKFTVKRPTHTCQTK